MLTVAMYQNVLSHSPGFFIDPLKVLAGTLGTLEIESVWVVDRVGGS